MDARGIIDYYGMLRLLKALEGHGFTEKELKCTGQDICRWLSISPGPRVGEVKRALLMHCACRPRDNEPKMLERIAKDIGKGNKA